MDIKRIAQMVGGAVEGDGKTEITGLSGIETSKAGDLTFAMDESKLSVAEKSSASCILTGDLVRKSSKPLIRVKNPKLAFLVIYNALNKPEDRGPYTHPTAYVSGSARLGESVWIGAHVSIANNTIIGSHTIIESNSAIGKNCRVGDNCHIYSNVTLYDNVVLKNNIILHSGAVIGSDGFGYVKEKGVIYKFPQLGKVIIEDNVEIGANTAIDRGSLNDTIIGSGTKIDNLCQIAHNVIIGKNCLIAGQCGISGSTVVGDNVIMAGQVGLVDNIVIGEGATLAAQSAVIADVEKGAVVWGTPARPIGIAKRQMAVTAWMCKNFKSISKLVKEVEK